MTEAKIARFDKEGRGNGQGPEYRPWLTIRDLSSRGRSCRMHGITARREHHFFSDLEYALGLECDWDRAVVDLREQFPLPRPATIAIAEDIGVKHPTDPGTGCHVVLTTDLLLDVRLEVGFALLAIAVKYASDLEGRGALRVLEKLEIERRYWRQRGVAWALMTEHEIFKDRGETYRRLRQYLDFEGLRPLPGDTWTARALIVEAALATRSTGTVAGFCAELDRVNGWEAGDALAVIWHLLANRRVEFDLAKGLDAKGPLSQLRVPARETATAAA